MNKTRSKVRMILTGCLAAALTFSMPGSAFAAGQWSYAHGHSGHLQFPRSEPVYFGSGLQIATRNPYAPFDWIQIAIPGPATGDVSPLNSRFIKVKYHQTGCTSLSEVHVYNGSTRVGQLSKPWDSTTGFKTVDLDLGRYVNFDNGLGLSIKVAHGGGIDPCSFRFILTGVGAKFE